ncbi:MAG: hypothetical protein M3X11_05510, partial [Acidobacteriota bacterium]|nr:hypothetical protein [Acidobacteriota bacterium]
DRISRMTDPTGVVTQLGYDENNNLMRTTKVRRDGAPNQVWQSEYDAKNRLASRTDPLGRKTQYRYDLADQLSGTVSPLGRIVSFLYDDRGDRRQVTNGLGNQVQLAYDNRHNLTTLTDERSNTTTFAYDELFRKVAQTDPLGRATHYEYDAEGNIISMTDRLGRRTNTLYDALNRRERVNYEDAVVDYDYDPAGRLMNIKDVQNGIPSTISWLYDNANRVTSETTSTGKVKYDYNEANQRKLLEVYYSATDTIPRSSANYAYDSAGRLFEIWEARDTGRFRFRYDDLSRLSLLERPNNVKTDYEYTQNNRLKRLKHSKVTAGVEMPLEDFLYDYNDDDEIASINRVPGTVLASADTALPADPANRLPRFGVTRYTYDEEGHQTLRQEGTGAQITDYLWDARNRLTRVRLPDGRRVNYNYDALGRRTSRVERAANTVISSSLTFLYDNQDIVLDKGTDGSSIDYLNGLQIDQKLRQSGSRSTLYFLSDHLNSTVALTNDFGERIGSSLSYEAYGAGGSSLNTRFTYTGRELDSATGLMYYRARYYAPEIGRFISEDPSGFQDGANLYAYVNQNPVSFTDPSGLFAANAAAAGAGFLFGAAFGFASDLFYQMSSKCPGEDLDWSSIFRSTALGGIGGAITGASLGAVSAVAAGLPAGAIPGVGFGLYDRECPCRN